jgi:acyl-CoA synthetase (AMP-forming)/AMP-acid ligase II
MLAIHPSFKLYQQERWQSLDVPQLVADGEKSNVVNLTCPPQHNPCVHSLIEGLVWAAFNNVPVVLNRDNHSLSDQTLPDKFMVGVYTSGTTGKAKITWHELSQLIPQKTLRASSDYRWLLSYHPMTFAGLQVLLHTITLGNELVVPDTTRVNAGAKLAVKMKVNAISATPSMFRNYLLYWKDELPPLKTITCGGEICGQELLDLIRSQFPNANIRHIYATSEAGVVFSVNDERAGFPTSFLDSPKPGLTIIDGELVVIRSNRFIHTGDMVTREENRVFFTGRKDNIVNVGGEKVNIEMVEQRLMAIPEVDDVLVYAKPNPITGNLIGCQIVSSNPQACRQTLDDIKSTLSRAAQPRIIQFVERIDVSLSGKKKRRL